MNRAVRVVFNDDVDVTYSNDGTEEWRYDTGSVLCGVSTSREPGGFMVWVDAAEHVRVEPLETRLRSAVAAALDGVEGVEEAYEEDREVWTVLGEPSGEAVTRAVATAVESLSAELAAFLRSRGEPG